MGSKRRDLGRLQDIEDKSEVEKLSDNRAVISTDGNVKKESDMFKMKVQVKKGDSVKTTEVKSEDLRGLIRELSYWIHTESNEDLTDLLKNI
jgi:hypothetical protein